MKQKKAKNEEQGGTSFFDGFAAYVYNGQHLSKSCTIEAPKNIIAQ